MSVLVVALEVSAARHSAGRLWNLLRAELESDRVVLVLPPAGRAPERTAGVDKLRSPARAAAPRVIPDMSALEQFDPRLAGFVKDNPALEEILAREIARDVNRRVLDFESLLEASKVRVAFDVGPEGRIARQRVEESSRVPSIDHLVMELVTLLDRYGILAPMKGLERVTATVTVSEAVEIRLEGETADAGATDEVRRQVQNVITLLRLGLGTGRAAPLLEGITLTAAPGHVLVATSFGKELLSDFLKQLYRPAPRRRAAETQRP